MIFEKHHQFTLRIPRESKIDPSHTAHPFEKHAFGHVTSLIG